MKLENVLAGVDFKALHGGLDKDINDVCINSLSATKNCLFAAIKGYNKDGHDYIEDAVKKGACAILCENSRELHQEITYIFSDNIREELSKIACNFYGTKENIKNLFVTAITGTNGKSSTVSMLNYIFNKNGIKCSMSATTGMYIDNKKINDNINTTPDALSVHQFLKKSAQCGCKAAVIEASAQASTLHRIDNIGFKYGIFTNLSPEHLDFYDNVEKYYKAKEAIMESCEICIVNSDDIYGRRLIKRLKELNKRVYSYAIYNPADYEININNEDDKSIEYEIVRKMEKYDVKISIPSESWVYNSAAALIVAAEEGYDVEKLSKCIYECVIPEGRMEKIENDLDLNIIIDYAHTLIAFETVLTNVKKNCRGRLISVFGCGGDRDKTNRPQIGKCVSEISDICIITNDNPRSENQISIFTDIISGIKNKNYAIIQSRKEAINLALNIATEADTVIILGKGHERYQIIDNEYIPFDEKSIIKELLSIRGKNGSCNDRESCKSD